MRVCIVCTMYMIPQAWTVSTIDILMRVCLVSTMRERVERGQREGREWRERGDEREIERDDFINFPEKNINIWIINIQTRERVRAKERWFNGLKVGNTE